MTHMQCRWPSLHNMAFRNNSEKSWKIKSVSTYSVSLLPLQLRIPPRNPFPINNSVLQVPVQRVHVPAVCPPVVMSFLMKSRWIIQCQSHIGVITSSKHLSLMKIHGKLHRRSNNGANLHAVAEVIVVYLTGCINRLFESKRRYLISNSSSPLPQSGRILACLKPFRLQIPNKALNNPLNNKINPHQSVPFPLIRSHHRP